MIYLMIKAWRKKIIDLLSIQIFIQSKRKENYLMVKKKLMKIVLMLLIIVKTLRDIKIMIMMMMLE